ncbi:MAG: glycosyltransferase family 2 protein [Betaproteobacteria bacterium]|nr:glycosyltransferase family 2 protein [Betaproteobacteria bacterium]
MNSLPLAVEILVWFLFLYVLVHAAAQATISLLSWRIIRRSAAYRRVEIRELLYTGLEPPITVVIPAYNEESTIVTSVRSMLQLRYPEYELVVVNDGSCDGTLAALIDAFGLKPFPHAYWMRLETEPVIRTYRSETHAKLRVIDKANGGKADAINCGINVSQYPLVCCVDADSILDRDSLLRVVQPFIEDSRTVACGGTVRLANGCTVRNGLLLEAGLPRSALARQQIVEYLRGFLFGRMGWSQVNGLLIISGAFGLMHKDTVVAVGGYRRDTIGEDMELVVRMHRVLTAQRRPYRISYVPDPICWTEAPEDWRTLKNQRVRWQRGLCESLWANRALALSPHPTVAGWIAFPYFVLFEWAAPIVELSGYALFAWLLLASDVRWDTAVLFLLVAVGFSVLLSTIALMLEEISFHVYPRSRHLFELFLTGIAENFGYRQLNVAWRLLGMWHWFRGKRATWGVMRRKGMGPHTSRQR